MTAPPVVRTDTEVGVATLVLNRPGKRNALGAAMVEALAAHLAEIATDESVRVVALRGAGRDFCAGADLAEIAASQSQGPEAGLADAHALSGVLAGIRALRQPVVAVVHGRALGGGAGLATACDLVLAREDASFGYPEVHLGFVPALVLSFLRRKIGESRAFELLVRGRPVKAREALSLGLVNQVMPHSAFDSEVQAYVDDLASRPPTAMALTKQLFHGVDGAPIADALARGAAVNALARLTDECREGVRRFLSRA